MKYLSFKLIKIMIRSITKICLGLGLLAGCSTPGQNPPTNQGNSGGGNSGNSGNSGTGAEWLIPQDQVFDGGPGKDGIPALSIPKLVTLDQATYLSDHNLVLGFSKDGEYRAYPHNILDWHEIINDDLLGDEIAVTYCPLTGTGIGWNREVNGGTTTFGVSGLLYNTNLIPYDRETDSNWCQISMLCVNGELKGKSIKTYHIVETTWKTWKKMFPDSKVISESTGYSRNYRTYPYGDYRTNNERLLFPVSVNDGRLPAKERVLTVVENEKAKVYRFRDFDNGTARLVHDQFEELKLLIIGSKKENFIVAFKLSTEDLAHTFTIADGDQEAVVFEDDNGNQYDFMGNVVSGPNIGSKLLAARSFMAYWFSVPAFYQTPIIFNPGN